MTVETKTKIRRVVTTTSGSTVLSIGVAMIVLPGPAFVVIPAGLTILAREHRWAQIRLAQFKVLTRFLREKFVSRFSRRTPARALAATSHHNRREVA
jgi:tellurite resistance protein TerC